MFAKILCLTTLLACSCADHSAPTAADIIKGFYSDYRRMDDQRLRSELLILWISTVGNGDFDTKQQISTSCQKLAMAAADVWQDLPTVELAAPLVDAAITASMADVRSAEPTTAPHPMEKVCHHLEQSLQLDPTVNTKFLRFQRQPKSTPPELATNAKHITGNASVVVNQFYAQLLVAPKVGQLIAHGMFVAYVRSHNCALGDYRLAKAVVELAKKQELQAQTQLVYEKALYDVVQFVLEILNRDKSVAAVPVFQITNGALMGRVRDNFHNDPKLWAETENMLKVVDSTVCKSTR